MTPMTTRRRHELSLPHGEVRAPAGGVPTAFHSASSWLEGKRTR